MPRFIDLTDQFFGRLTILERAENYHKNGSAQWKCQCTCGTTLIVRGQSLRSGRTRSCGCLNKELATKRKLIHGMCNSPEHRTWTSMIQRCTNPKNPAFEYYGGRGIGIFSEWKKSFLQFYKYIGPRPSLEYTIERIDNDKSYEPGNVKWATRKEQQANRRGLHLITFNGQTKSLSVWAQCLGMKKPTLKGRIVHRKWPIKKAFTEPVRHRIPSPFGFNKAPRAY